MPIDPAELIEQRFTAAVAMTDREFRAEVKFLVEQLNEIYIEKINELVEKVNTLEARIDAFGIP